MVVAVVLMEHRRCADAGAAWLALVKSLAKWHLCQVPRASSSGARHKTGRRLVKRAVEHCRCCYYRALPGVLSIVVVVVAVVVARTVTELAPCPGERPMHHCAPLVVVVVAAAVTQHLRRCHRH